MTPLHLAAQIGSFAATEILLNGGADVDARDALGRSPLYIAIGSGDAPEVIFLLRGSGADPFSRTASGSTPYDLALLWDDRVATYFSDIPQPDAGESPMPRVADIPSFATRRLVDSRSRVGAMERMEDGHWYFTIGTETQDEVDDPSTTAIYSLQTIAALDSSIIPYLEAAPGTYLVRSRRGGFESSE
jgi:hypothetical protein